MEQAHHFASETTLKYMGNTHKYSPQERQIPVVEHNEPL